METVLYPPLEDWDKLCKRTSINLEKIEMVCREVFDEVSREGDKALSRYTELYDRVKIDDFAVSDEEKAACGDKVPEELKRAILTAKANIEKFHRSQLYTPTPIETSQGVYCRQEIRPISRVGLYIPGGQAPLFSTVLMLAVPASVAGCSEVVLCSPPNASGEINPVVLWTAIECGVKKIYKVGGTQAIAAMTLGTETIPSVYKIFGPGNQYVMAAKQLAQRYGVAIDMPAGPSEVMVVADDTARAKYVAADMLSQAEHGPDSQSILATSSKRLASEVEKEVERQLALLPRREVAIKSLLHSRIVVLEDVSQCIAFSNAYAPEHLILSVESPEEWVEKISDAGSVFMGHYTPESAGDYASGTNHTLPTSSYARTYSGVNMDAFVKKITFQSISREGLKNLSSTIMTMAQNECLDAHSRAVSIRLEDDN